MPQCDRTSSLRRRLGASARPTPASLVRASQLFESLEERRLLAADPLTPDHPLWAIPTGTAAIDGLLDDSDWSGALEVYRTQATRSDNAVWVRAMYNAAGLFLSVEARDANLWADGNGGGAGDIFEVEQDDSVVFYFDPDNSRDNIIQDSDRVFGVNLGDMNAPVNTNNGAVQRVKHVKGANSLVAAPRVAPGVDIPGGLVYATSYEGTLNNSSDTDIGWVVEVFMPWDTLNMAGPPAHGDTIGMNFEVIFDNNGGGRDFFDLRNGPDRFDFPHFIDDTLVGAHSSFSFGSGGVNGPVNYAEAMFINNTEVSRPRGVNDLAVGNSSPFGAQLTFTAPAGTSRGAGHVTSYDIRYSTTNITSEQDWANATRFENIYTPRLSGLSESLRIAGFQPASPYFISVRAVDASGNVGPLTPAVKVETRPDDGTQGRIIPAPNGYGLMFEDGTPFVPVGDHLGKPWAYTRTLFPGDIWDPANGVYQNFFENGAIEGDAETYFQTLQDQGVNTMRLYLEFQGSFVEGNPDPIPNGTYWLENNRGQFNPDMREFLHNVMDLAAQHDIYLILSPFNPFDYDDVFGSEGPWATNFGGPLTSINDFFQTNETLEMAQLRMTTIADWVGQNSNDHIVLGYETISEWDARWTVNDDQSATEMRQRAVWMQSLAAHIRDYDPDRLVLNSTVQRDPRGPIARNLFYDRTWDALTNHFYLQSNDEPINNTADDKSVFAAEEMAYFSSYFATHRNDNRPILNGEWGMTPIDWERSVGFRPTWGDSRFSQADDEAIFRTVIWSGFATGQIGTGLRISTDELVGTGFVLTDGMRDLQLAFSQFAQDTTLDIDWANLPYEILSGRIEAQAAGQSLLAWGFADGADGMAYIVRDGNVTATPASGGVLTLRGMDPGRVLDIEFWDPSSTAGAPVATLTGVRTDTGDVSINLPTFAADLAVKFKARTGPRLDDLDISQPNFDQGDAVTLTALPATGSGVTRVDFYYDINSNGRLDDDDLLLGADDNAAGGFTFTLTPQQSALVGVGARQLLAVASSATDGAGDAVTADANVSFSTRAGDNNVVRGVADTGDNHRLITVNQAGEVLLFEQEGWDAINLTETIGAPRAIGDAVTWQDPKDGLIYAAYPAGDGVILLQRGSEADGGAWTFRNLTAEQAGAANPGATITQFVSAAATGQVVVIAGVSDTGRLFAYQQTGAQTNGAFEFTFVDISSDLDDKGFTTPDFAELISYRPSWDAWHLTGLDATGRIISVWQPPGQTSWRLDDLTTVTGAEPIAGGLSAILTSWNGISLTGLDASGAVVSTWWVPQFGGDWRRTDLTEAFDGPTLSNNALTSFYTGWDAQNYAGVNEQGEIVVYWWVPQFGGEWRVSTLTEAAGDSTRITSPLNAHASTASTLNVFGAAADGSVVRASWQPGDGLWSLENLSELADRA